MFDIEGPCAISRVGAETVAMKGAA